MNRSLSSWDGLPVERLVKVHQESMPTDSEIAEAASRLLGGRLHAQRGGVRFLLAALVQGFVIGLAVLASAAFVADRVSARVRTSGPVGPAKAPALVAPRQSKAPPAPAQSATPIADDAPAVAKTPAAQEDAPRALLPANRAAGSAPFIAEAEGPEAPVAPSAPSTDGPWQRVARALSSGDLNEADRHLHALTTSPDAETRDAAELARAELFISHGRGGSFRASVARLAASGSTPLIRKRAAALLTRPF